MTHGITMRHTRRDDTFIEIISKDPSEILWRIESMMNIARNHRGYSHSSLLILLSEQAFRIIRSIQSIDHEMVRRNTLMRCDYEILDDYGKRSCRVGITIKLGLARDQDIPFEDSRRFGYRDECIMPIFVDDKKRYL